MKNKIANDNLSRITIDLPIESHKRLKVLSSVLGRSMRDIVVETINERLKTECPYSHTPNEETIKTIKETRKGKNLVKCKDLNDLFDKLGI